MVTDGCRLAWALRTVRHARLEPVGHVDVADEGIAKNHSFDLAPEDVRAVAGRPRGLPRQPPQA